MKPNPGYLRKFIYILGDDRGFVAKVAMLYAVQGLMDFIGASLVGPLILMIASPQRVMSLLHRLPLLPQNLSYQGAFLAFAALLVVVYGLRGVLGFLVQRTVVRFAARTRERLQLRILNIYLALPYSFYVKLSPVHMAVVVTSHASNAAEMAIGGALRLIGDAIVLVALLIVILVTDVAAVLILSPVLALAILLYRLFFTERIREAGRRSSIATSRTLVSVNNAFYGIKEIRILGLDKYFADRAQHAIHDFAEANVTLATISVIPRFFIEFMVIAFVAVLAAFYALRGDAGDQILATLGVLGVVGLRLIPSLQSVMSNWNNVLFSRPSVEIVYNDMMELDRVAPTAAAPRPAGETARFAPPFRELELRRVGFRYPGANVEALAEVDFAIHRGQSVGIVGPSGAGKSTLVDLVMGLLEPSAGRVICNGVDIRDATAQWQRMIAYIPQLLFLIDDTLRRNVALGTPDDAIDEAHLRESLRQARLLDLAESLPEGLDTVLGDRGTRLSGGQRQRVVLARAFYFEREVLIMDEATSALDHELEQEIIEEINRLRGVKTLIVIAHRSSTVQNCDTILHLDRGRVAARGSFTEIIGHAASRAPILASES